MNTTSIIDLKISSMKKDIKDLSNIVLPKEIICHGQNYTIPSDVQPANGTIYFVVHGTESLTLPDTSKFSIPGQCIYIFANAGDKIIKLFSDSSNDIIVLDTVAYSDPDQTFKLYNRGFVQLLHTSGGWYVISKSGFNLTSS